MATLDPEPSSPVEDYTPTFYVGHHDPQRPLPVTDFVLRQAQDVGVGAASPDQRDLLIAP